MFILGNMNKIVFLIIIIVACIILNGILFTHAKKSKGFKKKLLMFVISVVSVIPVVYGYLVTDFSDNGKEIISDNNTDSGSTDLIDNTESNPDNDIELNTSVFIKEIQGYDLYSIANANDLSESEIQISELDRNMTMIGSDEKGYSAEELIGCRICTLYLGEDGEECLFAGQYNENYHWNGQCLICAYKNGKLLYTTQDTYNDGRLIAYKRISYYSAKNKWMYTDRILTESGNNGDTWSYIYKDVIKKEYDADDLKEEQIYTPYEVRELLKDGLISHYHGRYVNHEPNDESGDAYQIKYENGVITEIYRGEFYDFHYITGFCIRINEDKTYTYMEGTFHDKNGKETFELVKTESIDEARFKDIISSQPFSREVLGY